MKKFLTLFTLALTLSIFTACNHTPTTTENIEETQTSNYKEYSTEALTNIPANQQTVLFFHASWCPTCRAAEKDILANVNQIPTNTIIYKIDYDSEKTLKEQYDVNYQHTFVLVDKEGNKLGEWVGLMTLEELMEAVNNN